MEGSTVVACPSCGKQYQIDADKIGQTFKCVSCQTQFQAGAVQASPGQVAPPPVPVMPASGDPWNTQTPVVNYNSGGMYVQKTSGMAIASLVCGIVFCIPGSFLLAIVFGIIGIVQTKPGQAKGRGMAIAGLILGCIGPCFLASIMLPSLNKARETANRAKCASNMHQIGLAMLLYENENQQQYPPDLTTLMTTEQLTPAVFVCPASNDTPTPAPAQLESGGHCSYKYIYPGPTSVPMSSATTAVLYEPFSNHQNDGTNILFADGHVEWFNAIAARQYIPNP